MLNRAGGAHRPRVGRVYADFGCSLPFAFLLGFSLSAAGFTFGGRPLGFGSVEAGGMMFGSANSPKFASRAAASNCTVCHVGSFSLSSSRERACLLRPDSLATAY